VFRTLAVIVTTSISLSTAAQINADAAMSLFKSSDCRKCHDADKTKGGPSLKRIASKYKGKPDAEQKIINHMTQAPRVKLENGKEEDHLIIDTKDQKAINNVAQWILSR
jgi:cytochrome c